MKRIICIFIMPALCFLYGVILLVEHFVEHTRIDDPSDLSLLYFAVAVILMNVWRDEKKT